MYMCEYVTSVYAWRTGLRQNWRASCWRRGVRLARVRASVAGDWPCRVRLSASSARPGAPRDWRIACPCRIIVVFLRCLVLRSFFFMGTANGLAFKMLFRLMRSALRCWQFHVVFYINLCVGTWVIQVRFSKSAFFPSWTQTQRTRPAEISLMSVIRAND